MSIKVFEFEFLCLCLSVCLSVSLSHTHTHTLSHHILASCTIQKHIILTNPPLLPLPTTHSPTGLKANPLLFSRYRYRAHKRSSIPFMTMTASSRVSHWLDCTNCLNVSSTEELWVWRKASSDLISEGVNSCWSESSSPMSEKMYGKQLR